MLREMVTQGSPIQATSEEVKEVYAQFGLAYYYAEVLHRGLCNLYALSQIPASGTMTRPRMAEHLAEAYNSTFGKILNLVQPLLPESLVTRIKLAIEKRNFLAHHFWFDRIHLVTTSLGTDSLVRELKTYSQLFKDLDAQVEKYVEPYHQRAGINEESIHASMGAVLRGEPDEPLIQQRRLGKQEVITAVYEAPTEGGGRRLVFETEDGNLWQLCDVGLGWTTDEHVGDQWRSVEAFDALLPARIDPRPRVRAPWSYEIRFGNKAYFLIRPGGKPNQFLWTIRIK